MFASPPEACLAIRKAEDIIDKLSVSGSGGLEGDQDLIAWLEMRLGSRHTLNRLGKETQLELKARRGVLRRLSFRHIVEALVPVALRTCGLSARGQRNARQIEIVGNEVRIPKLPKVFDGFTILHLSDLHADISEGAMAALPKAIRGLEYDICVITGDFRGRNHGPYRRALALVDSLMADIHKPTYGILGNHDAAALLPGLEQSGIRMLMNESAVLTRGLDKLCLAGVDDPHFYRVDDLGAALTDVPQEAAVVLLSHSADRFERAEQAGVGLLLCGHTHGGQLCLPGRVPVTTSSHLPRRMAAGSWRYGEMAGYTSRGVGTCVVEARFNCPPEVTLHTLRGSPGLQP